MEGEAAKKRENLDKFDPELLDDEGGWDENYCVHCMVKRFQCAMYSLH